MEPIKQVDVEKAMQPKNTDNVVKRLPLEQQLEHQKLSRQYERMSQEQAIEALRYMTALYFHNKQAYQEIIASKWGLLND